MKTNYMGKEYWQNINFQLEFSNAQFTTSNVIYTRLYFIPFMEADSTSIKLSIIFVITIILSFSDTALLSLFMIY